MLEQPALTWEPANKNRVVCIGRCRRRVWALGIHLVSIYNKLEAVFDLLSSHFMPLSIAHMARDPSIIDGGESASAVINMEQKLGSRKMSSHRWLLQTRAPQPTQWKLESGVNTTEAFLILFFNLDKS